MGDFGDILKFNTGQTWIDPETLVIRTEDEKQSIGAELTAGAWQRGRVIESEGGRDVGKTGTESAAEQKGSLNLVNPGLQRALCKGL